MRNIDSILDTDFYKITMQRYVLEQYPLANVKYYFKCRNKNIKLDFLRDEVIDQVNALKNIKLNPFEFEYLRNINFLSEEYLNFLSNFRFRPDEHVRITKQDGDLHIDISGKWVDTILYEVPILSIVNELYFEEIQKPDKLLLTQKIGEDNVISKIKLLKQNPYFRFSDFGTRRRYSRLWQKRVLEMIKNECPNLIGTSNVKLAMDYNLKAIGTMAHEVIMCNLSFVDDVRQAQKRAFYTWMATYGNNNGIALSDTFTTQAFFKDFDYTLASNFSGVRHDSGNAEEFANKMIKHYKGMGIDPKSKSIIFSDGLNMQKAISLYNEFKDKINVGFGIGTSLTNDLGVEPINIVIKAVECNGKPVVKLSDDYGKEIGDVQLRNKIKMAYEIF